MEVKPGDCGCNGEVEAQGRDAHCIGVSPCARDLRPGKGG